MPLAFQSASHGRIAFGFFNIHTDLLLLEDQFFFANRFCRMVGEISARRGELETFIPGWIIDSGRDIGDLHGAIRGSDLSGFIGATYAQWPFPRREADFRQLPEGVDNRPATREMVKQFGRRADIAVRVDGGAGVAIGPFTFDRLAFMELVRYVWVGGMPRWKNDVRPGYVDRMGGQAVASDHPLLAGLVLD